MSDENLRAQGSADVDVAPTGLKTSTLGSLLALTAVAIVVLVAIWAVSAARNNATAEVEVEGTTSTGTTTAVEVPDSGTPAPEVGQPAPSFSAINIDGQEINLEALRGRPVWLVFNATWCTNCRAELPDTQVVHKQYKDRIEIVEIFLSDNEQTLSDYARRLGLTFPQIADFWQYPQRSLPRHGVPTHCFIDAEDPRTSRTSTLAR